MRSRKALVRWLLDSDPSVRWQVLRDLTDEPEAVVAAERSRVAAEGWGAKLLELQSPYGNWGGKNDDGWMVTVDVLALLKDLGVDPAGDRPGMRSAAFATVSSGGNSTAAPFSTV